ncbi:hypothetical protein C8F04DRAFT_1086969 [Mycena alexandri]|uniref:Uncharacterized protein n=1 Tax=Mycena alexandri TaxID=1745969 RepID=A0AAD6T579_9AGAR|nr:hypothetical protein C8F04DRAFT_1086969 [Mycena alexandri]
MDPPPFYRAPANNHPVARASFQKPVAIPKAPIVNPYEKFTQPQFDAWIGDITGALRGALGYRAEVPQKPKARTKWHIPAPHSNEAPDAAYEDEDADEELEDSFAEVKARGAAVKGKGRDPREGPGLGRGDQEEEEDQDQDQEEELDEEDSWDENEGMGSDDEEEENALRNGESSARAHARYQKTDVGPDAVEVISDEEEDEPHANGLQTQDGEEDGEEYSDEENAFPTALLVAPQKRTLVTEEGGYSDDGEETGSESENEIGSSPPRPFEDEDEELEDDEIDLFPSTEQDEHETLRAPLNFSTQQDDQDDDVLPGSSPILSSPIEAEQSFQSFPSEHQDHEIFNVDEDDEDMNDAHNDSQSFDWNNPPAFEQGVPASGPGHLATPVEDDNVVDSDGYPPLQVFGTSDLLSTFNSQSQTESGSNDIPLQFHPLEFDEQYVFAAGPSSFLSAPGYFVTEADEQVLPENLEYSDAYTVSRDISVDPQHFTVEEAFTDHEPDGRGMSLDVATLDGEMEGADVGAENYDAILDDIRSTQYPSAEMVAAAFEATYSDGVVHKEEPQSQFFEVPMPISADPAVHDPFGSRPATPPRPPASLGFPGSPLLVSPVGTPTGQPTPVAIPVPASFLKAMHERQESSLFTPRSEIPSGGTTPLAGEGVQAEPVVEVVDVDEVDDEENAAIVNATDDAGRLEDILDTNIINSSIDTEVEVEEPRETQDLITDVTE